MQNIILVEQWKMQLGPGFVNHLPGLVALVELVRQHGLASALHHVPGTLRPFLAWKFRERPQWLDRRHEGAVEHFLTPRTRLTVPATIRQLRPDQPLIHLSYPRVFSKPEERQRPPHVTSHTRLPNATVTIPLSRRIILWKIRRPRTVLTIHHLEKIITAPPHRGIGPGNTQLGKKNQR